MNFIRLNPLGTSAVALSAALFLSLAGHAAQSASSGTVHAEYVDRPVVTVTTPVPFYPNYNPVGSFNTYGGSNYNSFGFEGTRSVYIRTPDRIFAPPNPPPLGQAIPQIRRLGFMLSRFGAPPSLAPYVDAPFYAPLSALMYAENLSKKRRELLDSYEATRITLVAELRGKLESLAQMDPATRRRELAAFATEQTPKITELELLGEQLRDDFVRGGFFKEGVSWNDVRGWRLGDDTRYESWADEARAMKGAAYFQSGISVVQRRLLRENAMELELLGREPTADIALDAPKPYLYFSPELSRIRLPAEMPAELVAKIAEYRKQKSALKKELHDTLYAQEQAFFTFRRTGVFKALAEKQAPQISALESLAEEIRVGLSPLPNPLRPATSVLPTELSRRVSEYLRRKNALQKALTAKLDEVRSELPGDRVEIVKIDEGIQISVIANRNSSRAIREKRKTIESTLPQFNSEQTKIYNALLEEKDVLRTDVRASAHGLANGGKSIDSLLREFEVSFQQQELWNLYRDYSDAVLEPGLSPEQRRLLFSAAIEKLDLPLPATTL